MRGVATLDTTKFRDAVTFVFRNSQRELPEIMNRGGLVAIIGGKGVRGAMQRTPKADPSVIKAVPIQAIAKVVMARARAKGQKLTRKEIRLLIAKEYRRRVAARGYTAYVGWNRAAMQLGGKGIGKRAAGEGLAHLGYARRATYANLVTEIVNTAPAAEKIGLGPLQEALNDTARDMIEYAQERMSGIFRQVSA